VTVTADVAADQVILHVSDDGPGIAPEALPRVFDKFVTAPAAGLSGADGGGQGTGLGLAIAKGIMEAHGGSIATESTFFGGRGTRMTMIFSRGLPA
jgi:two-component system sensor histidine kinase KdpD